MVWDDLEFSFGSDWAAGMLGLKQADAAIARAYQAALLGAFVSNTATTDLETITVAIGTFIHSHPAFRKLIDEGKWHLPYGDRTAYKLLRQS